MRQLRAEVPATEKQTHFTSNRLRLSVMREMSYVTNIGYYYCGFSSTKLE